MANKKYVSSSLVRKLATYPPEKYFKLILADAHSKTMSKAQVLQGIIKAHYDGLSEYERKMLVGVYDKMTPDQRSYPRKD